MNGYDLASTDALAKQWISFVADCFKNNKQKDIETLVESLEELDVLPAWFNICFAQVIKNNKNNCLQVLLNEFESSKNEIASCVKLLHIIKSFNISRWKKPKNFTSLLEITKRDVLANVTKKDLLARLNKESKSSLLTRLVTLQGLKTAIDFFDLSIKAIKRSTLYPDPKTDVKRIKVSHVIKLITLFSSVFKTFFNHLVDQKLITKVGQNDKLDPKAYTTWLEDCLLPTNASTLNPSPNFNAAGARSSAKTDFAWPHKPCSLDDIFTLIH